MGIIGFLFFTLLFFLKRHEFLDVALRVDRKKPKELTMISEDFMRNKNPEVFHMPDMQHFSEIV